MQAIFLIYCKIFAMFSVLKNKALTVNALEYYAPKLLRILRDE